MGVSQIEGLSFRISAQARGLLRPADTFDAFLVEHKLEAVAKKKAERTTWGPVAEASYVWKHPIMAAPALHHGSAKPLSEPVIRAVATS